MPLRILPLRTTALRTMPSRITPLRTLAPKPLPLRVAYIDDPGPEDHAIE